MINCYIVKKQNKYGRIFLKGVLGDFFCSFGIIFLVGFWWVLDFGFWGVLILKMILLLFYS